ncbi:hypothetical protein F511_24996 [Dorcoceras hygrometricum]|uniref:Uncharacterized protein n=1 Tax=Dorcoceras hygrometricum TaxID=472368 RepID=A0A2Z7CXT4_9LAMI|nr:hypothetical protein F511_24996 [Dorcoceras hygrometricum]
MTVKKSDCLSSAADPEAVCNATVVGDCLPEDEEFMMESEVSRMLLARPLKPVSPQALNPKRPFCQRNTYGSCVPAPNNKFYQRPCNYNNLCNRNV